ncbi:hypothetical protein EDE15_3546 [Edaphobacter aggregans]|uniref:IPT/TIG domain-containing protein n=1 Tax=Edaphobacter aggregans TaxID=570835 RepID=A0A3R9WIH8_9BACT|nr:hypothetical protein [Edaphobacter aggregans]RSL17993.1 hypothetical protein EDE15_3546 [Edaphobacter aggregans]
MTITIQPPKPGDLIRSEYMKELIDQLVTLDGRVSALEGVTPGANGQLSITRIVPTEVVIGDPIQIIGVNFGLPAQNIVTFDGGNSVIPSSGNDKLLNVIVPTIDLGGATQKSVSVGVSGGARGFDSAPLTVQAIQATIPAGTITVTPGQIPANIQPGSTVIFPFTIQAQTNLSESYNLVTGLPTVAAGQTAWTAIVTSDAAGNNVITQLTIPAPVASQSSTAQVFVKVTIPAGTGVANPFVTLSVNSVHNPPPNPGSPSGSFSATFTFGGSTQPPQTVGFAISTFTGSGVAGDLTGVSIPLPTPTQPPIDGISYIFQNLNAVQYTMSLAWLDPSNANHGWTASFGGAPGITANWPVLSQTITMSTAGSSSPVKVAIVAPAGSTQNTLIITVRAAGANSSTDYGILNQVIKPA